MVVRFLAERPTFFAAFLTAFLAAAFFVAVRFGVALRLSTDLVLVFVGFLFAAVFFVAVCLDVALRLTGDLVLALAGFFVRARRFEVAVLFRFDDVEADMEARLVPAMDTDRLPRRLTTLKTPGPGTKLVSWPVLQRTTIIEPFTAVTTPDRGPAFDDTSI